MINRRTLLLALSATTFAATARPAFAAHAVPRRLAPDVYPQGVASGDPTEDGVVLWTRMLPPEAGGAANGHLEVSTDADFASLIVERAVETGPDTDYTLRVVVDGLQPGHRLYYRFLRDDGAMSPTGMSRTAPAADSAEDVQFAFASCQNYQTGHYHAYRHLLTRGEDGADLDFVLFLGDFIYEQIFAMSGLARDLTWPETDGARTDHAVTLDDYRHLYRTYLSDPWLQRARGRWPFLSIWDDHEFSNNSWQSVSTYDPAGTPAQARKMAANQAWFEYIPARLSGLAGDQFARDFELADVANAALDTPEGAAANETATHSLVIPRRLRWGARLDLLLTDSRSFRSEHPIPPERALELSFHPHAILPVEEIARWDAGREAADPVIDRPVGTMWGDTQKAWLKRSLKQSDATWKVCALSVPMSTMTLDYTFVHHEIEPVETAMNVDAFDGYPAERLEFLRYVQAENIGNVVSLTGDHHMHFSSVLGEGLDCGPAANEFAVAGISSTNYFRVFDLHVRRLYPDGMIPRLFSDAGPGGERVAWLNSTILYGHARTAGWLEAGAPDAEALTAAELRNTGLRYLDSDAYGIALATATADRFEVEYLVFTHEDMMRPAREEEPAIEPARRTRITVPAGRPEQSDPEFIGGAPFPYSAR